jgi:hypothetical protein
MPLWPTKKDQEEDPVQIEIPDLPVAADAAPVAPAGEAPDQLGQLCACLGQLGDLLSQANQQVLAYLVERRSKSAEAVANDRATAGLAEKIDALDERIGQLDAKLERLANRLAVDAEGEGRTGEGERRTADAGRRTDEAVYDREEPTVLFPPSAFLPPASAFPLPPSPFPGTALLAGVAEGDPGACCLLGQLLIFRSAAADKMPPLLKDIGEAYYRWQPKTRPGPSPMEQALATWLKEALQDVGMANSIELVEPGERFDSNRHTASSRGVEITEVRGWVVLRDNGKVYTKAHVAVR